MLDRREDLGLSPAQVKELERIRTEFQRDAIKLDADQRVAQMDLAALLQADRVEMGRVEAKVREIERLRADLQLGRIRAIEQGKAQLTAEQRSRLQAMIGEPRIARPRPTPSPYAAPPHRF
jgi:Spy/CpxP family protein refolding chaperone